MDVHAEMSRELQAVEHCNERADVLAGHGRVLEEVHVVAENVGAETEMNTVCCITTKREIAVDVLEDDDKRSC